MLVGISIGHLMDRVGILAGINFIAPQPDLGGEWSKHFIVGFTYTF